MVKSFKGRLIIILYLVVLVVAGAVCWVGVAVVGNEIEARLVHDAAQNISRVMSGMNLRPTKGVIERLAEIANGEILVIDTHRHVVAGSIDTGDFRLPPSVYDLKPGLSESLTVHGVGYVVGVSSLSLQSADGTYKLLVLIPAQRIAAARWATVQRLITWTLGVVAAATVLILIAGSRVTAALRYLTNDLDAISRRVSAEGVEGLKDVAWKTQGPEETRRLYEAFQRVIASLEGAEEKLARLERLAAIGKVTASVVHEIRNPLSGIQMHVRLLQDEMTDNPDVKESLEIIGREVKRLDLYVDELVVLAKSGTPSAAPASLVAVDILEEMTYTLKLMEGKISHAGVDVKCLLDDSLPRVAADPIRIRQVFMNLLINALEATPAGGRVVIDASCDDSVVAVRFSDSGEGITTDSDDIFDAFVTTKAHGGGLGLYICRQIMDSFGGEIVGFNAQSGACFELKLRIYNNE